MPYTVRKSGKRGFKVCKKGATKCMSKKPLSKKQAVRQMTAIYTNERKKMM